MGVVAAVGSGIAAITGAIGSTVAAGVVGLGLVAEGSALAGTIASIAGPALFGAGVGAAGSAITGGNPLIGALTGGLTGGLGGAGAGGLLGDALGVSAGAGNALVGAGVGALGAGLSGGNPLLGAVTGGAGGYLSGGGLEDISGAFGGASGTGALNSAFGGGSGDAFTPSSGASVGAETGAFDNAGQVGSYNPDTSTGGALSMADNSDLNPQSRFTGAMTSDTGGNSSSWLKRQIDAVTGNDTNATTNPTGKGVLINADGSIVTPPIPPDQATFTYGDGTQVPTADAALHDLQTSPGYADTTAGKSAMSSSDSGGVLNWLGKNQALALGALSGITSLFNKPQAQTTANLPGPAQNTAWSSQPLNFQPLNPNYPGRTQVNPNVPNYYTYGQIPGGAQFFSNNSLAAYGFAKGGALSQEYMTNDNNRHVRGPGGPTGDKIPAMLSDGEYVLDHADVARIGGGSNARGARILDRERRKLTSGGGALNRLGRRAA